MLLGSLATISTVAPAGTPSAAGTLAPTVGAAKTVAPTSMGPSAGSPMVNAAVSSLGHGAGPARGVPADCAVTGGGQATCGGAPSHPVGSAGKAPALSHGPDAAAPAVDPVWYNVTANLSSHSGGNIPSVEFSGRMAYDPQLSEVVLFNGESNVSDFDNQTWVYNGNSWTNLTGSLATAPSGRQGAGLAYDPAFNGVVLIGGFNDLDYALNDTWVFSGAGWTNVTATVGLPHDVFDETVGWAYGGMAYDPALSTMVLEDGCLNFACTDIWGQTFFLNATGWAAAWGPGTLTNATFLAWSNLAYDAADGYMLSYGGYDYYEEASSNDTFTMTTWGTWVNITNHDAGCVALVCYTPPGRVSAAMTWDGQLNAVLLVDGFNGTTGVWLNDSWTFAGGVWLPADLTSPEAPSTFCGTAQPAMAEMSDNIAPFIIGGASSAFAGCWTSEWVYEAPPQATLTVAPHPIQIGTAVTYTAGWAAGTGTGVVAGWNVSYGNGHFSSLRAAAGQNSSTVYGKAFPYTYTATGTFAANATWTDFFYISSGKATASLTVYPALVATISASATSITAGGTVSFTTSPTGGSGTYTYLWSFGDRTSSTAQNPPAHTFSSAGTYVVNLTVTDSATGHSVNSTVSVTVKAATGFSLSGSTLTYLILGIVVLLVVIVAVVLLTRRRKKPASAAAWQSGTPPAGTGAPPSGAMGEAPPPPPS
jgi:PKD repeat protein